MSLGRHVRVVPIAMLFATAGPVLALSPAAADTPPRVRGVVTGIAGDSMTIKGRDGGVVTLNTGARTSYAYVVPSGLDAIKVQDFVGTAVKGPPSAMVAVELAIIPKDMQAGRIGFYGWDPLPDPTSGQAGGTTATSMINGVVSVSSPAGSRLADTSMINGAVTAETQGAAGRMLTVTCDGGSRRFRIAVPPAAPIVRYLLADRSALTMGSVVMVKVDPGDQADLVTIGKGIVPPM